MTSIVICNKTFMEANPLNEYSIFPLCGEDIIACRQKIESWDYDVPDDGVLIKVGAFSCNYRDKALLLQFNSLCQEYEKKALKYSVHFGSEFVAKVIAIGKEVKNFKIGDRVIPNACYPFRVNGTFGGIPTNHASARIGCFHENSLTQIPDSMPDEIAVSFTIAAQTVYSMIRKLELTKQSVVLVTAATSNTSLAAIKALVGQEIATFAISSSENFEQQLLTLGVQKVVPYSVILQGKLNDYIGNLKFDAIIDPYFDIYFSRIVIRVKLGGKYISCGFYNQSRQFEQLNKADYLAAICYCIVGNIPLTGNCLGSDVDLNNAIDDYAVGCFDIEIDSIYTMGDVLPFLQKTFHGEPRFGKVVYRYE